MRKRWTPSCIRAPADGSGDGECGKRSALDQRSCRSSPPPCTLHGYPCPSRGRTNQKGQIESKRRARESTDCRRFLSDLNPRAYCRAIRIRSAARTRGGAPRGRAAARLRARPGRIRAWYMRLTSCHLRARCGGATSAKWARECRPGPVPAQPTPGPAPSRTATGHPHLCARSRKWCNRGGAVGGTSDSRDP